MNVARIAVSIVLLLASVANSAEPTDTMPQERAQLIATAQVAGVAMYRHDRAGALATDAARKERKFRRDRRVRGWITQAHADHVSVAFLDEESNALYRIDVPDRGDLGKVEIVDPPLSLDGYEAQVAAARGAALAAESQQCSDRYNTVVLPVAGSESRFDVYLLPGTEKRGVVPIGGSHRVTVENGTIVDERAYTMTCITMQKQRGVVALAITHLLDDVPTDVHVFWSIWAGLPIYVSTKAGNWEVADRRVEFLEP